jgi:hypothetical protein
MVNPERALALTEAARLHAESFGDVQFEEGRREVLKTATAFYSFLTGPASAVVAFGPIVKQNTLEPTGKAGSKMAQIHDDEEFDLTIPSVADAKGAEIPDRADDLTDDPTFVSSDESVFTYRTFTEDPRKATVVAGMPGSAVGTVTIGSVVVTHAVDVVPGDVATVTIQEGEVRKQQA